MEWFTKTYEKVVAFFKEFSFKKYVAHIKGLNLIEFARELRHWIQKNLNNVLISLGVIVVLAIGIFVWSGAQAKKNEEAVKYFGYAFNYYNRALQGTQPHEQQMKDLNQARQILQQIMGQYQRTPIMADAIFYLGNIMYLTGEYPAAMERYQEYVRRFGRKYLAANAQESIGYCLEQSGDLNGAIAAYELVRTKYPQSSIAGRAGLNIGRCYESLNDFKKAFETYQSVLAYAPNSQWARSAQVRLSFLEAKFQYMQSAGHK